MAEVDSRRAERIVKASRGRHHRIAVRGDFWAQRSHGDDARQLLGLVRRQAPAAEVRAARKSS